MAAVNDSDDENMADDKFDNFTISEDNMFLSEEEDEEGIKKLISRLKKQLKIEELFKYSYPYDDLDYMLNTQNFTDSSDDDDNTGAVAMIESESENEVEINLYWSKIKMDELQGIRKPTEVLFSDTDSTPDLETPNKETEKLVTFPIELLSDEMDLMLDLESIPESEASSESVIFVFAPANLLCTGNSEIGSIKEMMELFNDEDIIELITDEGEDALTSFDAAMLVNVEGNVEGIQTELYNSGASRHMSFYRDHFEDYVSIAPKSITAADKQYFQAIGKGNL